MKHGRQNKQEPIPCFLPAFPQKGCAGYVGGQQQAAEQDLVGQLFSALSSSAGKNFSAASGRHSLAEAVFHFTMPLFGLIRSFHRSILHFTKPDPFAARRVPAQPSITEAEPRTCALRKVERRSPAQNKSASSYYILHFVDLSTPLSVFGGKIPVCAIPCGVCFFGNKI